MMQELIFYVFAIVAVFSATMVVVSSNPVRSALFLVTCFFATAGIWLLAEAEFLALVLILVYVGAVMTLFLFVIMMLDIDVITKKHLLKTYLPMGLIVIGLMVLLMLVAIEPERFAFAHLQQVKLHAADYSNVEELGEVLYTQYAYAFELAAVLLLVAIVAAISLAHRGPRNRKVQKPVKQMQVKRDERVRLV